MQAASRGLSCLCKGASSRRVLSSTSAAAKVPAPAAAKVASTITSSTKSPSKKAPASAVVAAPPVNTEDKTKSFTSANMSVGQAFQSLVYRGRNGNPLALGDLRKFLQLCDKPEHARYGLQAVELYQRKGQDFSEEVNTHFIAAVAERAQAPMSAALALSTYKHRISAWSTHSSLVKLLTSLNTLKGEGAGDAAGDSTEEEATTATTTTTVKAAASPARGKDQSKAKGGAAASPDDDDDDDDDDDVPRKGKTAKSEDDEVLRGRKAIRASKRAARLAANAASGASDGTKDPAGLAVLVLEVAQRKGVKITKELCDLVEPLLGAAPAAAEGAAPAAAEGAAPAAAAAAVAPVEPVRSIRDRLAALRGSA